MENIMAAGGLPDYRDVRSYGDFEEWSLNRWRWEFLRRRSDLRAEFEELVDNREITFKRYCKTPLGRNDPGFFVPSYRINPDWPTSDSPLPLRLFNPAMSDIPEPELHWDDWMNGHFAFLSEEAPTEFFRIDLDLRAPLRPQLKVAYERALAAQHAYSSSKVERRRHPGKWITYLRVLDARECGASWSKIREVLPPTTARTDQTARDTWKQAQALCFNF